MGTAEEFDERKRPADGGSKTEYKPNSPYVSDIWYSISDKPPCNGEKNGDDIGEFDCGPNGWNDKVRPML